jgi:hypothetical protein
MSKFFIGLITGFFATILGFQINTEINMKKYKHTIGTCLSNGLYYEKVLEIRPTNYKPKYVLSATINGKLSSPSTQETWLVDDNYVVVSSKNCL